MNEKIKIIQENPIGTRPSWDESHMCTTIKNSTRSSCLFVRSASQFIEENQSVASGYNGASSNYEKNCLETGCRKEMKGLKYEESLNSGNCIGIHSEMNGLGHLTRKNVKLTLYTTIFPCPTCAKNLQPYFIERLVFKKVYFNKEFDLALQFFLDAKTEVNQLDLSLKRYWDIDAYRRWKKFDVWSEEEYIKARKIMENWDNI
jgi:deoxycytidylate deaminase